MCTGASLEFPAKQAGPGGVGPTENLGTGPVPPLHLPTLVLQNPPTRTYIGKMLACNTIDQHGNMARIPNQPNVVVCKCCNCNIQIWMTTGSRTGRTQFDREIWNGNWTLDDQCSTQHNEWHFTFIGASYGLWTTHCPSKVRRPRQSLTLCQDKKDHWHKLAIFSIGKTSEEEHFALVRLKIFLKKSGKVSRHYICRIFSCFCSWYSFHELVFIFWGLWVPEVVLNTVSAMLLVCIESEWNTNFNMKSTCYPEKMNQIPKQTLLTFQKAFFGTPQ